MNKTITVNIAGIVFHIDETAYDILKPYLQSLKMRFSNTPGGDEIIGDIESRIAEMFHAKITADNQVIVDADVKEIITIMGQPEDFEDTGEDQSHYTENKSFTDFNPTLKKRLFRNPEDKLLGGVCSGISAYLDIDPLWLRLAFAVFFFAFGTGFFLYILLWIIIPSARTTAEKLQMRGERVNVENIERSIKEEMENVKTSFRNFTAEARSYGKKDFSGSVKGFSGRLIGLIVQILTVFFEVVLKIASVILIVVSLIVLGVLFSVASGYGDINGYSFRDILPGFFNSSLDSNLIIIGLVITFGVPFFLLLYKGIRLLFNIQLKNRLLKMASLGIWVIGVIILLIGGLRVGSSFRKKSSFQQVIPLMQPSGTLYVSAFDSSDGENMLNFNTSHGHFRLKKNENGIFLQSLELDIKKSLDGRLELLKIQSANGKDRTQAISNAKEFSYSFAQTDSVLHLNKEFNLNKFHNQHVKLVLKVPLGKIVYLDESLDGIIYDLDNLSNTYDGDMLGRKWVMTEGGLKCVDCDSWDTHEKRDYKYHFGRHRKDSDDDEEDEN